MEKNKGWGAAAERECGPVFSMLGAKIKMNNKNKVKKTRKCKIRRGTSMSWPSPRDWPKSARPWPRCPRRFFLLLFSSFFFFYFFLSSCFFFSAAIFFLARGSMPRVLFVRPRPREGAKTKPSQSKTPIRPTDGDCRAEVQRSSSKIKPKPNETQPKTDGGGLSR